MNIACLGWGSLVWDPRALPIESEWFTDGPLIPVEFVRHSQDGRITLVIDPQSQPVRVLWARMRPTVLTVAIEELRMREGILSGLANIGTWQRGSDAPEYIADLPSWVSSHNIDAVIWTALRPKFDGKIRRPSANEVVDYLRGLKGEVCARAREYVQNAPFQIETEYRRRIQSELGWEPSLATTHRADTRLAGRASRHPPMT
jgi:hypothetical protein